MIYLGPRLRKIAAIAFVAAMFVAAYVRAGDYGPWALGPSPEPQKEGPLGPVFYQGFIGENPGGASCHVSSIADLGEGRLIAAWYAGSREGARDVGIYASIYTPGKGWATPLRVVDRQMASHELARYVKKVGNASLARASDGAIWMFYSTVFAGGWAGTSLNYKRSTDGGQTWSRSAKLHLSPFFNLTHNVKNKALALAGGALMMPVYQELAAKRSGVLYINPHGAYRLVRATFSGRAIQPSIAQDSGGGLIAFYRNASDDDVKFILSSRSGDNGRTWSEPADTTVPTPNSGLDAIRLPGEGRYIIVANDSFDSRDVLSLLITEDGAESWRSIGTLEDNTAMEYSYPFIIRASDGLYHVTYTYERRRIRHVYFNDDWVDEVLRVDRGEIDD